ncbi:MAG TPA: hypothetical protein VFD92_25735 [Candidatus Binatia bacterium]|nr:hypothetical protein [Candidatus Binatia bacterium]
MAPRLLLASGMANNIHALLPLNAHLSPVRSPSQAKIGDIDRRFLDELTGVAAARHAPATTASTASASASVQASSGRRAIGGRQASGSEEAPVAAPGSPGAPAATDGDGAVTSVGTLSEDPHTAGMYVPPDFYHGNSYSPVFDRQDENGNWVPTPRFEGQHIYSEWRAELPPDFDPNARVIHDPLLDKQGPRWWKQDENGDWVRRPEGPGGLALADDGTTINTLDPEKFPGMS